MIGKAYWDFEGCFKLTNVNQKDFQQYLSCYQQQHYQSLSMRSGMLELVTLAKQGKNYLGIATSSIEEEIQSLVQQHHLDKAFDVIVTANDVQKLKPAPEVYQLALQKLGLVASEAIAIEDSATGATSAIKSGIRTVVYPNQLPENRVFPNQAKIPTQTELLQII